MNWLNVEGVNGLIPADPPRAGLTWDVRADVATAILTRFYPQMPKINVSTRRFVAVRRSRYGGPA